MNIPNLLTMSRLLLVPTFFLVMYYHLVGVDGMLNWTRIILIFIVVSDFLDGYLARRRCEVTSLGSVLDPMADKLFVTASFILLTVYEQIPVWLTIIVVTKDILVSIGWCMLAMLYHKVEVNTSIFGKLATVFQYGTVCIIVLIPINNPLIGFNYLTAITTILALVHYGYQAAQQTNGSST